MIVTILILANGRDRALPYQFINSQITLNREYSAPKPDHAGTIYMQNLCHAMIPDIFDKVVSMALIFKNQISKNST